MRRDGAASASKRGARRRVTLGARALESGDDDRIYAELFDAILEQRLAPGTKLSEEVLGQAFGVSRTLIRQSLIRLRHEGVVSVTRNRGAQVAMPSPDEARQVLDARLAAEVRIAQLASRRIDDADRTELAEFLARERAARDRGEAGRALRLSGEFHLLLAAAAGNEPLRQFMRSLVSRTSLAISLYSRGARQVCSCEDHRALLDAIGTGPPARAGAQMKAHLQSLAGRLDLSGPATVPGLGTVLAGVAATRGRRRR